MKKTAITILMACALLGAGCSDSDEVATPTPTPAPTATPIPKTEAELKKEAEDRAVVKPIKDAQIQKEEGTVPSTPAP
jgi:PBP1b-binding outer membrane lipoprotein LpoB